MFYSFKSQDERKSICGSDCIEIQYCRLPSGTTVKELVSVDSIINWQNDSLYIIDENAFYDSYSHIFDCGIYNNLKSGTVDIYGINYYADDKIDSIIRRIMSERPEGFRILAEWLENAKEYNGFYILGV